MKAAQIYIRSTTQYLDVKQDGDFPFVLSKSVAEIQDVQKRNKNYSKTFKVAATPANIQALGYPHVLGTDLDAINVYKQSAYIIVNGNVIDEGYIYIMKAVREIEVIEFECQFVGSNEAWVVGLQNIRMNQIFQDSAGSGLSVSYTDNDIVSRYIANPRTMADPSYVYVNPYMYQFSDGFANHPTNSTEYNGQSRKAEYTDFWPAFRVDKLVDGIFGTANGPLITAALATQGITFDAFKLDSAFLTDNATHGFWDNIYYSDRSEESYSTTFGASNFWGLFLPSQMTALDFFMKLVKTFNLVFDFDGITLKVEPRLEWKSWNGTTYDGFYGGTSVDWSNKIAKEQSIEYSTTNYKRQVRISYGTDSYPFSPSTYPFFTDDKVNQPEVRYIVDLNNNLEEGVTDIKLPFNTSPSKLYQPRFDFVRQDPIREDPSATRTTQLTDQEQDADAITWTPDPNYSDRLFVFKAGAKPMGVKYFNDFLVSIDENERQIYLNDPRWRDWKYLKQDGTIVTNIGYPYIYNCITVNPFANTSLVLQTTASGNETGITTSPSNWDTIDNVDPVGPTTTVGSSASVPMTGITPVDPDDINLGIYASNSVNMVDGLYESFWKSTLDHLVTTKTLVTKVRLTRNEFVTLDMSAYYTALGQRFILNAVKDYDPTLDEQMVEVELLSVDFVRASEVTLPPSKTLVGINSIGTKTDIITGTSSTAIFGRGTELQRGRYVYFMGQASNADNQTMTARGITQSSGTLSNSASSTIIFNNTADFDPYGRGQAGAILRLNDSQCIMVAPIVGTGNVFNICTYDGGTNNITINFTINDGDTNNYIDRQPNFALLKVTGSVYTIASVGLTKGGAFPYARVWDLDTSAQTITPRGILYPMGTSGSGNGQQQLVNLGVVDGKHCFAIFYAKATSSSGVLYYAVYEYNTSTNTLVEAIGDTLYKSGSNHIENDVPWKLDDGKGVLMYLDRINYDTEITTCIYDGTTFTVGTPSSFGSNSKRGLFTDIRQYYDGTGDSKTQFLITVAFWESGTDTGDCMVFPAYYNPSTNTWDVSKFDTAESKIIITDESNPTSSAPTITLFIGQEDVDNGAVVCGLRTLGNTSFRGVRQNNFTITNT